MERQIFNGVKKFLVLAIFVSAILIVPQNSRALTSNDLKLQEQNVAKLTNQILSSKNLSKQNILKIAAIAKERKLLMLELAKTNPSLFLSLVISKTKRSALPLKIRKEIEEKKITEGTVETIHIDDFKNTKNSKFNYFLNSKGKRFNFYPTKQVSIISGTKIRLEAYALENIFVSEPSAQTIQVLETPALDSTGDQQTLVFLVRFLDSAAAPFTKEQAYNLIFNGQFQNFMKEQSYGKVSFSGLVSDWITLNATNAVCGSGDVNTEEIKKFILDNNIDLNNYGRVVFISGDYAGGCSGVGKSSYQFNGKNYFFSESWVGASGYDIGMNGQPFDWTSLDYITSHEIGHALGVMHANGFDCGDKVLSENCTHIEYGNAFDVMGTGSYSNHFNGFYKEKLGWIDSSEVLTINKSGTYTIAPLEINNLQNTVPKIAKIEINTGSATLSPFYLEHRIALGFDAKLNNSELASNQDGLFINKIVDDYFPYPQILDAKPTTQYFYYDLKQATLNSGDVFDDSKDGVIIKNVKKLEDKSMSFDVVMGDNNVCQRFKPGLNLPSFSYYNPRGTSRNIQIYFVNQDSYVCGSSEFSIIPILPSGWTYQIYFNTNNNKVDPDKKAIASINFSIPEDANLGVYSLLYKVVNITSGLEATGTVNMEVVEPPFITDIKPQNAKIGDEVQINGSGFAKYSVYNNAFSMSNDKAQVNYSINNINSEDGKTLKFKIPEKVTKYSDCGASCDAVATPDGDYTLSVFAAGMPSNTKILTIGSAVSTSSLTILSPNDGESLNFLSRYLITWKASSDINKFSVALYKNDMFFRWINTNIPVPNSNSTSLSDYSYFWSPASVMLSGESAKDVFKIYIIGYKITGGTVEDKSDVLFSIVAPAIAPTITVLSPNGGETLVKGKQWNITWKSTGFPNGTLAQVILYNTAAPFTPLRIINPLILMNSGSFLWNVPVDLVDGNYLISVVRFATFGNAYQDRSDAPFSIVGTTITPTITVLSPNGGETLTKGKQWNITWKPTGFPNGTYAQIQLRSALAPLIPLRIISLLTPMNSGSFLWNVPINLPDGKYLVWIVKSVISGTPVQDISDSPFSIVSMSNLSLGGEASALNVLGAESFHFTQFLEEGIVGFEVRSFLNKPR